MFIYRNIKKPKENQRKPKKTKENQRNKLIFQDKYKYKIY